MDTEKKRGEGNRRGKRQGKAIDRERDKKEKKKKKWIRKERLLETCIERDCSAVSTDLTPDPLRKSSLDET